MAATHENLPTERPATGVSDQSTAVNQKVSTHTQSQSSDSREGRDYDQQASATQSIGKTASVTASVHLSHIIVTKRNTFDIKLKVDNDQNLNLNSLLVRRQIDNPSPGAVTGGN